MASFQSKVDKPSILLQAHSLQYQFQNKLNQYTIDVKHLGMWQK